MKIYKYIIFILALLFISCGYVPMSYYANRALGNSVYVDLKLNMENPEDSVNIKDSINQAIVARFHSNLARKEVADTILNVNIAKVSDTAISTSSQGFATFYRVFVVIEFSFKRYDKNIKYINSGYYDYSVSLDNPIVTYNNRSNAIIEAAGQCIDKFISQVGVLGSSTVIGK